MRASPRCEKQNVARGRTYTLGPLIGRGGFGSVYCAQVTGHAGFRKRVALKMVNRESQHKPHILGRMRDEARMLGLVRHRAIVHVEDLILLDQRWTLVMEWVDGVDLASLIAAGPVPFGPAMEMVEEVAAALDAAWNAPGEAGTPLHLLHRDIKPSNVRLTPQGEVKLLDFGTARATFDARESNTQGDVFGSLRYIAPERLNGEEGPAADIWSLGLVLLELLLGQRLRMAPLDRERHQLDVQGLLQRIDPEAVDLLRTMLSWEPQQRPTAVQVAREARSLGRQSTDPSLRDWAATHAQPESTLPSSFEGPLLEEDPQHAEETADTLKPATYNEEVDGPLPKPSALTQTTFMDDLTDSTDETSSSSSIADEEDEDEDGATITYTNAETRALVTARLLGGEKPALASEPPINEDDASTLIRGDATDPYTPRRSRDEPSVSPPTGPSSTTGGWVRTGMIGGVASVATVAFGLLVLVVLIATGVLISTAGSQTAATTPSVAEQP